LTAGEPAVDQAGKVHVAAGVSLVVGQAQRQLHFLVLDVIRVLRIGRAKAHQISGKDWLRIDNVPGTLVGEGDAAGAVVVGLQNERRGGPAVGIVDDFRMSLRSQQKDHSASYWTESVPHGSHEGLLSDSRE